MVTKVEEREILLPPDGNLTKIFAGLKNGETLVLPHGEFFLDDDWTLASGVDVLGARTPGTNLHYLDRSEFGGKSQRFENGLSGGYDKEGDFCRGMMMGPCYPERVVYRGVSSKKVAEGAKL